MNRRWALIPVVLVTLAAATACPVSYYNPPSPTITSFVVSPSQVVAGSPFTVTVSATDTVSPVATIVLNIVPVGDVAYRGTICDNPPVTPGAAVTQVFTCTLPDFVPNGIWKATTYVDDEIPPGPEGLSNDASSTVPFSLVGGSEDRQPPVLISKSFSTDPAIVGQPFTITIDVSDDHLNFAPVGATLQNIAYQVPNPPPLVFWPCPKVTPTQLSPTVEEYVFTCLIGPEAVAAEYGGEAQIPDQYGHELAVPTYLQVIAAP